MSQLVVFTDLDGTLLDHDTYSWEPARPALDALAERGAPVVIVTSKTAPEVESIRADLGNTAPYVVENGGAVIVPAECFPGQNDCERPVLGQGRDTILAALRQIDEGDPFDATGFAEMGTAGIAAATGLTLDRARQANDRLASEPLQWRDSAERLERLARQLQDHRLHLVRGGRFVHVMGLHDKGDAVAWLTRRYRAAAFGQTLLTVGLGDGPNDLGMLASVDVAVIVRGHHDLPMTLPDHRRVVRTHERGPGGWRDAIFGILEAQGL